MTITNVHLGHLHLLSDGIKQHQQQFADGEIVAQ